MTDQLILSIDQGTTSSRTVLFDKTGSCVHVSQKEIKQYYPEEGWVEHDAMEILESVKTCLQAARDYAQGHDASIIVAGLTNQRETIVLWERASGKPLHPAIVWQDRRTTSACDDLRQAGRQGLNVDEESLQQRTGLFFDPYFSASKLAWLLDHVPGARNRAEQGELAAGTIDTFLCWHLLKRSEGKAQHVSDVTNASRTSLMNLESLAWDQELLELFAVPQAVLPEIRPSTNFYGELSIVDVPLCAVIGDQQSAAVGQACIKPGMLKSTYGTGCFVLANTGERPLFSSHRLLTTVAYQARGELAYALEGSLFNAGSAIQWLRDELQLIDTAKEVEALAERAASDSLVTMVPAFSGLGAPAWNPRARAAFFGLTRSSGPAEMCLATLQAIAWQTRDLLDCMEADGLAIETMRVDGGMTANALFVRLLAERCALAIDQPEELECTALGAALLAFAEWQGKPLASITQQWRLKARIAPTSDLSALAEERLRWRKATEAVAVFSART